LLGFSRDGVQETTFDSQDVDLSSKKSIDKREQEPQKHLEEEHYIRGQSYTGRLRRNIGNKL
jgi:type IV secretory pathway VirD2 relaxase